jgi:ribosome-associated protein
LKKRFAGFYSWIFNGWRTVLVVMISSNAALPHGSLHCCSSIMDVHSLKGSLLLETREFRLRDDHVRLCDLLKLAGVAESGGRGKQLVAAGAVLVDGQGESRKTAKIRAGQQVDCQGVRIIVRAPE